jgi:PAS domain S-box-containing protein
VTQSLGLGRGSDPFAPGVAERRLQQALRAGGTVAWAWDLATDHVLRSDNAEELLGLRSGPSGAFDARVHPDDRERHRRALAAALEAGEAYQVELRFLKPDGTVIWVLDKAELQTAPSGGRVLTGIAADITARKHAELEAHAKASLLEATLENMDQGLLLIDPTQRIALSNRRVAELLDLSPAFLASRPAFEDVRRHQAQMGEFAYEPDREMERILRGGPTAGSLAHERIRPNGTALEVRTVPLAGGGAVRTFTDITARKTAEEALRQSEERARDFANIASDWFWETDADFRYTALMGATQVLLTDAAIGKTPWDAVGADGSAPEWRRLAAYVQARKSFRDLEFEVKLPRGRSAWLSSSGHPLHDHQGRYVGYRGVSNNITLRKAAEAERDTLQAQLREAQKIQTVGQLTGGIAHDFNNLLAVILGNAEIIAENPADPALAYGLAQQIVQAAERGSDLTQKLLAFGRRQSLKPERLKLKQVVEGMEPLLHRTLGEHIELRTDLRDSALAALTDRTLLESAILNLAVNARDAMPQGGTLTIRTGQRAAGPGEGALPIGQAVVYVTVADTGTGMTPEVLARVFEPFFTTKDIGKGSGLGLSMVYGFAQQTGGHVSIESRLGVGSAVTIVLPAITMADVEAREGSGTPKRSAHGERILVVEDEPSVLQFVTSQLVGLGYEVEAVSTGPDALELLMRDRNFDLLFTDVVMPKGISGIELAKRARQLKPALKVLLTSGYSEDAFEQHGRPEEGTLLLRKPYRRKELAETMLRVLSHERGSVGLGA